MNTKVMEYLIAIAQEGSITKAAQRFYLTQADLSRHVRAAEEELGVRLFHRTSTGVRPTRAGIVFLSDAQAILHTEAELARELAAMRDRQRKRLRVMVDTPFYNQVLRVILPRFQERCPDTSLEVTNCNALQARRALLDGTDQLGLFHSLTPQGSGLEYLALSPHLILCVFPPDYEGPADPEGLRQAVGAGMYLILYPVGSTMRTLQEEELAAREIYPAHILEGAFQNSIGHIRQGGVCGLLPEALFTPQVRGSVRVGEPFFTAYPVLAWSPLTPPTGPAQTLMELVMEVFRL